MISFHDLFTVWQALLQMHIMHKRTRSKMKNKKPPENYAPEKKIAAFHLLIFLIHLTFYFKVLSLFSLLNLITLY